MPRTSYNTSTGASISLKYGTSSNFVFFAESSEWHGKSQSSARLRFPTVVQAMGTSALDVFRFDGFADLVFFGGMVDVWAIVVVGKRD